MRQGMMLPLTVALALAGCSEDEAQCPTSPDGGADGATQCLKDKVQCKSDETNAYGVCLPASASLKVPAGEFLMGHTETGKDHSPEHKVTLKEFQIDLAEVTVAQYRACVDCGVCPRPLRDGSHTGREPYYGNTKYAVYPAIYVSWTAAKAYCEGIGKRLPTEAEWEKAARGTQGNLYPWGADAPSPKHANYGATTNDTLPVADLALGKSPSGALNMAGNVWEWVEDSYDAGYYGKSPPADPKGPASSTVKVMRGGSFLSTPDQLRTYARARDTETAAYSTVGFRCAK